MNNPTQVVPPPPANQVIVTPVGVVPAAPPAPPVDPEVAAANAAEARNLAEAQTQPPPDRGMTLEILQGSYYLILGIWPVVHGSSFQRYIGGFDLGDLWLLRTLSLVLAVIGVSLLWAVRRRSVAPEAAIMAAGVAAVLAIMDLVNVTLKVVPPIYGFDAMIQAGFVYGWIRAVKSSTDAVHLITK